MKIRLTENDITLIAKSVLKRLNESFDEEKYSIDFGNIAMSEAFKFYLKNQNEGMQFMQKYYPEGLEDIQEFGYADMIEEACGEAKVFWEMPYTEADSYSSTSVSPSGNYDIPDDVSVSYSNLEVEIEQNAAYLLKAGLNPALVSNIKAAWERVAEDPENDSYDYKY